MSSFCLPFLKTLEKQLWWFSVHTRSMNFFLQKHLVTHQYKWFPVMLQYMYMQQEEKLSRLYGLKEMILSL